MHTGKRSTQAEMFSRTAQAMTESREWSVRLGKSMIVASVRITSSEAERTDLEKPARTFTDVTSCRKATLYRLSSLYRQTSLKYIRDYIGKRILLKGLRCYDAVTKITLKKGKVSRRHHILQSSLRIRKQTDGRAESRDKGNGRDDQGTGGQHPGY